MRNFLHALIISCALIPVISFAKFNCNLKDSGEVYLSFIFQDGNAYQEMNAFVGNEKWSAPFEVLKKCQALTSEFTSVVNDYWGTYQCISDGISKASRYIEFGLTQKGQSLLGNKGARIIFVPKSPIIESFEKSKDDSRCDPY